jgi:hypothetical protein
VDKVNKEEQEKFHLIEWIILISDTNPCLLEKLSNEEIEKNYLKSIEKVTKEIPIYFKEFNCTITLIYLCNCSKTIKICEKGK